jgi:hypothetical protein|tara:strand:- start:260 stop:589 length:330 start_codon:yes stop_codon:yes gene_type:complete
MPRSKPSKVEELRITLGTKERQLAEEAIGVMRTRSILGNDGLAIVDDPVKLIALIETIATVLELFGFETPIPTPVDAYEFLDAFKRKAETRASNAWDVDLRRDFERFFG